MMAWLIIRREIGQQVKARGSAMRVAVAWQREARHRRREAGGEDEGCSNQHSTNYNWRRLAGRAVLSAFSGSLAPWHRLRRGRYPSTPTAALAAVDTMSSGLFPPLPGTAGSARPDRHNSAAHWETGHGAQATSSRPPRATNKASGFASRCSNPAPNLQTLQSHLLCKPIPGKVRSSATS